VGCRHTTTARELVRLPGGGVLIDTPGLRAVTLWMADDGFRRAFADIEALVGSCRFHDCAHDREPGCAVQTALEGLMQGRTTICIAHRLSTILKADLIVVLDAGHIVETGTHAALIERGGVYRKLYELQFQG